jgi:hypothetical protein
MNYNTDFESIKNEKLRKTQEWLKNYFWNLETTILYYNWLIYIYN